MNRELEGNESDIDFKEDRLPNEEEDALYFELSTKDHVVRNGS